MLPLGSDYADLTVGALVRCSAENIWDDKFRSSYWCAVRLASGGNIKGNPLAHTHTHFVSPRCISPLKQLSLFSRKLWTGRAEVHLQVDVSPDATSDYDEEVSGERQRLAVHVCMDAYKIVNLPRYVLYRKQHLVT